MSTVKFAGCWFCIVASVALMVFGGFPTALAVALAILAIAFAMAPATW